MKYSRIGKIDNTFSRLNVGSGCISLSNFELAFTRFSEISGIDWPVGFLGHAQDVLCKIIKDNEMNEIHGSPDIVTSSNSAWSTLFEHGVRIVSRVVSRFLFCITVLLFWDVLYVKDGTICVKGTPTLFSSFLVIYPCVKDPTSRFNVVLVIN